jgi:aspartate aminotransferase
VAAPPSPTLADWVARIDPSPTSELEARVAEMIEASVPVWRLGLGEPDFATPDHVKDAAIAAIRSDFTRYTHTGGIPSLRQAIVDRLKADLGVVYAVDEVIVSVGGKHALYNAIRTLCRPGDEVLIPSPYWVTYPQQVKLSGAIPVIVPCSSAPEYKLEAETLEAHLSPHSRLVVLNDPNNPTGAVYRPEELAELAHICLDNDLYVVSDEVYSAFTYVPWGHTSIASLPAMRDRTVLVHAVSKSYGMTGWRIGYAAAPKTVVEAMLTLQSHVTSNPNSIAQRAAEAALVAPQDGVEQARQEYDARRRALISALHTVHGLRCSLPDGAFYVWVDASAWCGRVLGGRLVGNADDLAAILLDQAQVAVVPGTGFGADSHLRLSFAAPLAEILEGVERMRALLGSA